MLSSLLIFVALAQVPVTTELPVKDTVKTITIQPAFQIERLDNVPIYSGFTTVQAAIGEKILLTTKGTLTTTNTSWIIYPMNPNATLEPGNHTASFVSDAPGSYWLVSSVSTTNGPPALSAVVVIVGTPEPPDPVPPGPGPDNTALPLSGFRVLCLYDSQSGVPECFAAKSIKDYLSSHCIKGDDGVTPERRIWDENMTPDGDFSSWTLMTGRVKGTKSPCTVISTGKLTVVISCIDEATNSSITPETFLQILKKYGGT